MFFLCKLKQIHVWPKHSKGERCGKKPGFRQGIIHCLVILGFLGYNFANKGKQLIAAQLLGTRFQLGGGVLPSKSSNLSNEGINIKRFRFHNQKKKSLEKGRKEG